MAILTYPLNGITYDAEDVEVYLCTRTSGVFASDGHFPATVSGRIVSIGPGLAWMQNEEFHGKAIYNPETVDLTIAEADPYQARKDRIVLQFDKLLNQTTLVVKQGTPSSNPTAPAIERDSLIYELGLYIVNVPSSSISVTDANVECTFLDESVCGIMEDGVTGIPTQELYDQWYAWFSQIQTDTDAFENQFNQWFADIKEQAEKNMEENQEEFDNWMTDTKKDFDDWFDNLEYVLDGDVAGKLEVEIENAQDTADTAMDQLATGWVEGYLTDGDGNALLAEDDDEGYGITISRPICNCEDTNISFDKIYPVGSIYMSVNSANPAYLFGGTWQQIQNAFLLAAGSEHAVGETGGAETVTLSADQIPSHTHSLPSHSHSFSGTTGSTTISGDIYDIATQSSSSGAKGNGVFSSRYYSGDTVGYAVNSQPATSDCTDGVSMSAPHTHTFSGSTGGASGTSEATGGDGSHNNMPPYLAVYMWQRIA